MIEIRKRFTAEIIMIVDSENLRGADLSGADLSDADLRDADLREANLREANLSRASLSGANLRDANLHDADLHDASLSCANLRDANLHDADLHDANLREASLSGADLRGADLSDADLSRADLSGADLSGADLRGADLTEIRNDLFKILDLAQGEVPALMSALETGRVNGSVYTGDCACLIGTIANARACSYKRLDNLTPDNSRPAERWFLAIRKGDTKGTNQVVAITLEWIAEFQKDKNALASARRDSKLDVMEWRGVTDPPDVL